MRAATGAGSRRASYPWLQRWDLVAGAEVPPEIYRLEDLAAPATPVPALDGRFVVAVDGDRLVGGSYAEGRDAWRTVWAFDLAGKRAGPAVTGAPITSVAIGAWPAVFIARADGTVSLVDLESGDPLCPALQLPAPARDMAVAGRRDLIVGTGTDVARFRPPTG